MRAAVADIDEEHSDQEFADKVKSEHHQRKRLYGVGTLACESCHKPFETQWALNQHMKKCRHEDSKHVKLKLADKYPYSICHKVCDTITEFKRHNFLQHSESDI